jgi:hypothetical protein
MAATVGAVQRTTDGFGFTVGDGRRWVTISYKTEKEAKDAAEAIRRAVETAVSVVVPG